MKTALCTLFEGSYHHGVAALCNSLVAAGYRGELWAGHRGALPRWATGAPQFDPASGRLRLNDDFTLCFVALDTALHFNYYKPAFMRRVLEVHAPDAHAVAYFDPDIVVKCDWSALEVWFDGGIALVEDVNEAMPPRHPKRLLWTAYFARHGHAAVRTLDRNYNAGFIGVPRELRALLDTWDALCTLVWEYNGRTQRVKSGAAATLFNSTDQDAMNFALMQHDVPLNTAGRDAMDFVPGGYYLSHAIDLPKPWSARHLLRALRGYPPSLAMRAYYRYAGGPLRAHSAVALAWRRLSLGLAAVIGRFYRRY